jgi:hypothetical protein
MVKLMYVRRPTQTNTLFRSLLDLDLTLAELLRHFWAVTGQSADSAVLTKLGPVLRGHPNSSLATGVASVMVSRKQRWCPGTREAHRVAGQAVA